VYVLCEISPIQLVPDAEEPGDGNETPPRKGLGLVPRARETPPSPTQAEPLRGPTPPGAAQARPPTSPGEKRQQHWFATSVTPSGKDDALLAARELRSRLPVLRRISDRHVRAVLREFFLAGWSVGDVILAIDRLPHDRRWEHDGATGVTNVGAWLAYRLRPWRDRTGTARRSPSQRAAAEHVLNQARQRARAEEHKRALAQRSSTQTSPVAAEAMRTIRQILRSR
jgi:hypothetical protein